MTNIITGSELLRQITNGTEKVCGLLTPNYGPNGRNTIYDQKYDIPIIVNSGKKILSEFQLEDKIANIGSVLLKDAAMKMDQINGDGIITTAIIAGEIIREGKKMIAAGADAIQLRQGIKKGIPVVEKVIRNMAISADNKELLKKVASIAADDKKIGLLAANAFDAVGPEGIVIATDSQEPKNRLEIIEGIKYGYGYISSAFINVPEKRQTVLKHPYILLVNKKIRHLFELKNILDEIVKRQVSLLIIAANMDEQVVTALSANVFHGIINAAVTLGPGHGDTRRRNMQALAAKTGGIVIEENCGLELEQCSLEMCGQADYVYINKDSTLICGLNHENKEIVYSLQKNIESLIVVETESHEIEKLNLTKAILDGKMANIIAGGITEYEMFENLNQIENAVNAVYAAIRTGVTAGGGRTFLLAIPAIEKMIENSTGDEKMGLFCIKKALTAPVYNLAENAGDNGEYVVSILSEHMDEPFWGYDAVNHTFRDLLSAGILDPAETLCLSFRIAAEVAAITLTVSAAVVTE